MSLSNRRQPLGPLRGLDRLIDSDGLSHSTSKMSVSGESHRTSYISTSLDHINSSMYPLLSKRKVNHKICEWFDSWSEWQRKVLICGLTNICSTTQLESFATSLEPIFHRDFVTQMKQQYPSLSFKKVRPAVAKKTKKKKKKKPKPKRIEEEQNKINENADATPIKEIAKREVPIQDTVVKPESIDDIATGIIDSALHDAMQKVQTSKKNDDLLHIAEATDMLGNLKLFPDPEIRKKSIADIVDSDHEDQERPDSDSSQKRPVGKSPDNHLRSEYHNALSAIPLNSKLVVSKSVDNGHCCRQNSFHTKHHTKVPSSVTTTSLLRGQGQYKKNAQAQIRILHAISPLGLHNADIPVQNMFKSARFFGVSPREGTSFIKPEKGRLNTIFQEQLSQIWHWLEGWEPHERLTLLAMIMKMSSTSLLTYMAQCLYQRLQERINMNWLPDSLLLKIFSYLPANDIDTCSKVCRRWQYVSSLEELWISKCQKMGAQNGIHNIVEVVKWSNKGKSGIDWRKAYSELKNIARQTKDSVSEPKKFTNESSTHNIIPRQNGMFLPRNSLTYEGSIAGSWDSSSVKVPEKGLGLKLARESEKLKKEYRKHKKLEMAKEKMKKREENSLMESEQNTEFVSLKSSKIMSSRRSLAGTQLTLQRANSNKANESLGVHPTASEEQLGRLVEVAEDEVVAEWIREQKQQQHRKQDNESEQALDVRHNLVQAKELLGKAFSSHALIWRDLSNSDDYAETYEKYGGIVKGLKQVRKLLGHMDAVLCTEYDRRRLISGSMDRSVRIWDFKSGRTIHKLLGHKGGVTAIAFENTLLYTGSWDMSIMVWDLVHFERIAVLTGHRGSISSIKIAGNYLISASHDGSLRFWNRRINKCMKVIFLHKAEIMSMAIDDNIIITGSSDCTIKSIDMNTFKVIQVIATPDAVHRLVVQDRLIITANVIGHVTFWNRETGESEAAIQAHSAIINGLAYHEGRFFTAAADAVIKEWDLLNLTCLRSMQGHKGGIQDLKVDDKFAVSCDSFGIIRVWEFSVPPSAEDDKQEDDVIKAKVVKEDDVTLQASLEN